MPGKLSTPTIRFRLVMSGAWADPRHYLHDPDPLLKHYLLTRDADWSDLGLEIRYDGLPWNTPVLVDSAVNLMTWFQGVERLINGETEVDVWAWEESECRLRRDGSALTISDLSTHESAFCPEVHFNIKDFVRELRREGQVAVEFLETLERRIREISGPTRANDLPALVACWINDDKNSTRDHEAITALRYRWKEIREIFDGKQAVGIKRSMNTIETLRTKQGIS